MTGTTFGQLLDERSPVLMPACHDAFTARMAEHAGFRAFAIGGFAMSGMRYALPDVGLVSFGEAHAGIVDIIRGSDLPVLVDAGDGYGDVKNVTRVVRAYEEAGASCIMIEDQVSPKRIGGAKKKSVIDADAALRKIDAALAARRSDDCWIMGRTDARSAFDLEEAIRRAELFMSAGCEAIFVDGAETAEEMRIIAAAIDVPKLGSLGGAGPAPIQSVAELDRLGYSLIGYPATILLRVVTAIRDGLRAISDGELEPPAGSANFEDFAKYLGIDDWTEVEQRHDPA